MGQTLNHPENKPLNGLSNLFTSSYLVGSVYYELHSMLIIRHSIVAHVCGRYASKNLIKSKAPKNPHALFCGVQQWGGTNYSSDKCVPILKNLTMVMGCLSLRFMSSYRIKAHHPVTLNDTYLDNYSPL